MEYFTSSNYQRNKKLLFTCLSLTLLLFFNSCSKEKEEVTLNSSGKAKASRVSCTAAPVITPLVYCYDSNGTRGYGNFCSDPNNVIVKSGDFWYYDNNGVYQTGFMQENSSNNIICGDGGVWYYADFKIDGSTSTTAQVISTTEPGSGFSYSGGSGSFSDYIQIAAIFANYGQTTVIRITSTNSCGTTTYDVGFTSANCGQ